MDIRYVLKNLCGYFRRSGYVVKNSPFSCTSSLNGCTQYSLCSEFSIRSIHTAITLCWYGENLCGTTRFQIGSIIFTFIWQQTTFAISKTHQHCSWNPKKPSTTSAASLEKSVWNPFDVLTLVMHWHWLLLLPLPLPLGVNDTSINQCSPCCHCCWHWCSVWIDP